MKLFSLFFVRCKMFFLRKRFHQAGKLFIRSAYTVKGHKFISIGEGFFANRFLRIEVFGGTSDVKLKIGNNVKIGESIHIGVANYVEIGDNVLMGSRVYITDHNHGIYSGENQSNPNTAPVARKLTPNSSVIIKNNVWLGDGVVVLPGVTIGHGSIIGANSVVTSSIAPCTIAVGTPCKAIKKFDETRQAWARV